MAKNNKSLETVILQLEGLFPNESDRVNNLFLEYKTSEIFKNSNKDLLYRLLHITRLFDTSLRIYLENIGELGHRHSLGEYLTQLSRPTASHSALNGGLKQRYQSEIVDERNKYMHTAGTYPAKGIVKLASERIYECLQVVLTNHTS